MPACCIDDIHLNSYRVFYPLCARHDAHAIQHAQRTLLRGRRIAETVLCRRAPDESLKGLYYFSVLDDMVVSGVWGWQTSAVGRKQGVPERVKDLGPCR